ncbi:hypothetical protein [Nocardioides sp.]|uniref:hypothetical protein n=1 Tax=Nocardioides sp. TaxID=35761 RepID=UPI002F40BD06
MSEQHSEQHDDRADDGPLSVPDEDLPEDLRPTEENPLAQPAGDDVPEDLLRDTAGTSSRSSEDAGKGGGDDDASSGPASSEHHDHQSGDTD